jgi:predicted acyl esterase
MRHCRTPVVFLIAFCLIASAQQADTKPEPPEPVDLIWGVKIPMRDGVRLNATVYRLAPQPSGIATRPIDEKQ